MLPCALALLASLLGCAGGTRPGPPPPVGASAFRFVEPLPPPAAGARAVRAEEPPLGQPVDVYLKSRPIPPLANPVYPAALLGRVRQPAVVAVQLRIDEGGRVTEVRDSLAALTVGGEHAEEFRRAVEGAVLQWRFRPAEIRRMVRRSNGAEGGTYWETLGSRPADDACDVAFTFTLRGEVTGGAQP